MFLRIIIAANIAMFSSGYCMEEKSCAQNPSHNTKPLKVEELKSFQSWFLENSAYSQLKKFNGIQVSPNMIPSLRKDYEEINHFLATINDKNALKQPHKLFNERVLRDSISGFLNFVIGFHGAWKELIDNYALVARPEALGMEISYFFKECSEELRTHFNAFQRLSTIFLTGYSRFFGKSFKPFDVLPGFSNSQIYMGYFSDENGFLPLPLDSNSKWEFQPLLYGHDTTIPDIGHRGFVTDGTGNIIRCSGLHISCSGAGRYNLAFYRGENDPNPFYSQNREISFGPSTTTISGPTPLKAESVFLLKKFIEQLEQNNNGLSYDSFVPLAISPQDSDLNNYIFLEDLKEELRNEPENLTLLGAAAWVLKQEGVEPAESTEELVNKIEHLQENLKEKLLSTYEEEILAEQKAIRQRHIQEEQERHNKKGNRKKRSPHAKGKSAFTKTKTAPEPTTNEINEIKAKAQTYLRDNVQKARVTYRQLSKLTNNMIKEVFSEHKDIFKKNIVGSHINIHIEGSEGVTLVKKHRGGNKDLTIAGGVANDYMSKLVNKGIRALSNAK